MSEKWDYPWPPDYETIHGDAPETLLRHLKTIERWLGQSEAYQALASEQRFTLHGAIWFFDSTATKAAQHLRRAGVPDAAIGAATAWNVEGPVSSEQVQNYLQAANLCRRAREAVFAGRWGEAVNLALHAGQFSQADLASEARRSRVGRRNSRKSPRKLDTAKRNRRIGAEAVETAERLGLSDSEVAEELAKRPGYPGAESIRKIIRWFRKSLGI